MYCGTCKSDHPSQEGITLYTRKFKCVCGRKWTDTWCANCNDKCPDCNTEMTPVSTVHEEEICPPIAA